MDVDGEISEHEKQARLEERREKIIRQVREFAHETFHKLGAASRQETETLLQGVEYLKLDEQEITGWEQFCDERLTAMLESAQQLYFDQFMDPLLGELGKTISTRVIEDLNRKFKDENVDYKAKEQYIRFTLPKRIKEWRALKTRRDELKNKPLFTSLTTTLVPRLEDFLKEEKFIDLKYPDRKGLTDQVEAAMNALKRHQEKQYADIHAELTTYAQEEEIMHASKVGMWLKRIFDGKRTPEEINTYMEQVVRPFVRNWREAMYGSEKYKGFMDLEEAFDMHGVPRGLQRKSKDQFLLMSYKQKTSYLALAWTRIHDPDGSLEKNKELSTLKLRIRHNLDTEDWEGAEQELVSAQRIAPDDSELRSMQTFLNDHRPDEKQAEKQEQPEPHALLQEMREIITAIPGPLQPLYQHALTDGPAVFGRLTQVICNRVWLHDCAGWNTLIERERIEYLRATKQQGKGILLDLNAQNGDSILRQIREHADEKAGKTAPGLSADEHWGYWTSVIPQDVTINRQREIVHNDHYRLKSGLRALRQMGYVYTMSGELTRMDGTVA